MGADTPNDMADPVAQAQAVWESARAEHGDQDPRTLAAWWGLACARQASGDLTGAEREGSRVLTGFREQFGDEHRDTLAVAGTVARWRYHLGDPAAVEQLRELLPEVSRVLGAEHVGTLWIRQILISVEDAEMDGAQRLARWIELCGTATRSLGHEHVLTLEAAYYAAVARRELGDPYGASLDALRVYEARKRLFGERDQGTLAAGLARVLWAGEGMGADTSHLAELDELIALLTEVVGPDQRNTLLARFHRADRSPANGEVVLDRGSEWEVLYEETVAALGEESEVTRAVAPKLAQARTDWAEELRVARDLLTDMVRMEWEDQDDDEFDDDDIEEEIAEQLSDRAEAMTRAIAIKRELARSVRSAGPLALKTLQWRYYLGWWLWYCREFPSASTRARQLTADCTLILGEEHPLTVAAQSLLSHSEQQVMGGLHPYWEGELAVDDV